MTEYTHCIHCEVILNNFLRSSILRSILTKHPLKLEKIPYIVYACFIVHNFCELSNIHLDEELVQYHTKEIHNDDKILQYHQDNTFVCNTDEEQLVRDVITNYMKTCISDHLSI